MWQACRSCTFGIERRPTTWSRYMHGDYILLPLVRSWNSAVDAPTYLLLSRLSKRKDAVVLAVGHR